MKGYIPWSVRMPAGGYGTVDIHKDFKPVTCPDCKDGGLIKILDCNTCSGCGYIEVRKNGLEPR